MRNFDVRTQRIVLKSIKQIQYKRILFNLNNYLILKSAVFNQFCIMAKKSIFIYHSAF